MCEDFFFEIDLSPISYKKPFFYMIYFIIFQDMIKIKGLDRIFVEKS